ncbi:F-box/kelch-repeat protein At3g23880-like [Papaver somniferum]|uniref:F-box/kelch-repeat protein At3g23880-like n=1 Tax=Papaver somniferum TaxID=3469 RepID=UPI000E705F25|nr:F-box/kelch-repeat protein At3g23880-like [Papaver somniferum]
MFLAEIFLEILLKLPVKSTFVCKCVCKAWFSLISDPSFVKSHLNLTIQRKKSNLILRGIDQSRSYDCSVIYSVSHNSLQSLLSADKEFLEYAVEMDYPFKSLYISVKLMGCCDGLVCLCMIGFGYDSKSEDYKVVTGNNSVVEVYSLKLNSWRIIENASYIFPNRVVGIFINGDLHWLAQTQDCSPVVVSLDIGDQIFKEIQLPNEHSMNKNDDDRHISMTLGMLERCFCILFNVTNAHSEVWVMRDYGVGGSWTKRYSINNERIMNYYLAHLMWSFSGELLFGIYSSDEIAIIYDLINGSVRKLNMPSLTQFDQEGCYYESLVSLGSGTYVGEEEEATR